MFNKLIISASVSLNCFLLHCALAAAQCIVIAPVCGFVAVFVCLWVCYHDNSKLRASVLTKLGFIDKGRLGRQLIKFWPFRAPGKGVCGGAKFFGSALLQPARSVCVSLSASFSLCYVSDPSNERIHSPEPVQ